MRRKRPTMTANKSIKIRNFIVKYRINYGDAVGVFPKSALEVIKRAGEGEIKILLCLCACEGNADEKKLSKLSGVPADGVRDALAFWRGAGVVVSADAPAALQEETDVYPEEKESREAELQKKTVSKKLSRGEELPNYTSEELAEILENRTETATLINECQNIMGKVFSVREINVLMGFVDYLSLDCEYIMILLTYCMSIGKKTLHYAEKLAFALYDEGICTASELSEEIRRREFAAASEGKIRSMFGVGERALTSKEKKFIASWTGEMGYGLDIIERAYEETANTTGNASFAYANSILERWFSEGLRTLEEIEASYNKKKDEGKKGQNTSTFTDDFFDAAVRRALGDN